MFSPTLRRGFFIGPKDSSEGNHLSDAKSQRQEILDELSPGAEVPSYVLSRISLQYGARVLELRRLGFKIINRTTRVDGKRHGFFRLVSPHEPPSGHKEAQPASPAVKQSETLPMFSEVVRTNCYREEQKS